MLCGIGPFLCRPLPAENSNLEKNVEDVDQGAEAISTRVFHSFWVLLLAIDAHRFNELLSKALLSRQRSTIHMAEKSLALIGNASGQDGWFNGGFRRP
jgi:hypothetical protein